jgi:two-component system, cell cycle sensor histidine kinase and response regulator CckA
MVMGDSLSVLVVDEAAEILSFFSKLLDANGMRALLARNGEEAIRIAKLGYVPIDLVVTDVFLKSDDAAPGFGSGPELVARLREWRPEVRVLYMSAFVDSEMIRIELGERRFGVSSKTSDDPGLIESIRAAIAAPLEKSTWHIAAAAPGNRIS